MGIWAERHGHIIGILTRAPITITGSLSQSVDELKGLPQVILPSHSQ